MACILRRNHYNRKELFIKFMLSINDLKNGSYVTIDGAPYQVLEVAHLHIGRGGSSVQTRIKNLLTGQVFQRNYKPSDYFDEADIEKTPVKFIYSHRSEYWFTDPADVLKRLSLKENVLGAGAKFLKPNLEVTALVFEGKIVSIILPIKVDLKVVEAPPAVRGNTAQGATKMVKLESGAEVTVPLFIGEGDVLKINTETGEYYERMEKA